MWCYEFSSAFGATGGQAEQTHQTPLPLADFALPGAWLPPFLGRVVSQYSCLPALCCKHSKGAEVYQLHWDITHTQVVDDPPKLSMNMQEPGIK